MRRRVPRPNMRRAIVAFPSGLTLANLFFGIYAIVAASRGHFSEAGLYVVLGGVADALDGRVARATRTGSRFGEELDSLVDAISFGLAPALIMYFAVLNRYGWDWIFVFIFATAAVVRLARFNVEQAGRSKAYFHGLPSPAAGMTLATYYWFSQTPLYTSTVIGDLPWQTVLRYVMLALSFLMVSNVAYPVMPTIGFRTVRGILGSAIILATLLGLIFLPREFFFPAFMMYVAYGVVRSVLLGFMDRIPTGEPMLDVDEEAEPYLAQDEVPVGRRRRRRRKRLQGEQPTPRLNRAIEDGGE